MRRNRIRDAEESRSVAELLLVTTAIFWALTGVLLQAAPVMAFGLDADAERARKTYPKEFMRRMVELVRAGRGAEELAKEFEPSANTIRNWAAQADMDEGLRSAIGGGPALELGVSTWPIKRWTDADEMPDCAFRATGPSSLAACST